MTSSQTENFDSLSSNVEPINNLLDVLLDSEPSDNISEEHRLDSTSNIVDVAEFEGLANQSQSLDNVDLESYSKLPDIEVEVEPEIDLTLEQAVEYKAFLEQKTDLSDREIAQSNGTSIAKFEDALAVDTQSASTEELADAVNTLIPLIVELLKYKIEDSQESILNGITPILERIIEQRTEEEPQKMAAAIAKVLPSAITENVNISPEQIAKAIAPELALAIKEQIRLDKDAISEALGSEMGKAIKTQIEVEKDAMVDALYPVIGDTISKYMIEVVQEINSKVENTLSLEGLRRKFQAVIQGVSEAELILQESIGCHVKAVFLIDKDSGLMIQEVQNSRDRELDSDMLGGMLTAIRSFANDCIVLGSELDSIDYGNWQIHLEVAGYCYLAIVLQGEPTKGFIARIRRVFGDIILHYGDTIEKFEGNVDTIPNSVKLKLEQLIEPETKPNKKSSSPTALFCLLAFVLAILIIPWAIGGYRSRVSHNIEQTAAIQLNAAPELSIYRLKPKVEAGKLSIEGKVPSEYLRNQAAMISQEIASQNSLEFSNQIIAVDVSVNPNLPIGEISRLTKLFNQQPGVVLKTNYQSSNLSIAGFILNKNQQKSIIKAFNAIPGVNQTTIYVANQLPKLKERIYFDSADRKVNLARNSRQIQSAIAFLNQYPTLNLRLFAHNRDIGSKQGIQKLGRQPCANLRDVLIAKGVKPSRLVSDCNTYRTSTRHPNQTVKSTRYIEFGPFIPTKKFS